MSWGIVAGAAISVVGGYLASESASDSAEGSQKAELKAQKELQANKRKYELEDRKYRQDSVGNWSKYLDPKLIGTAGAAAPTTPATPTTPGATTGTEDHSAVDDPMNPAYAAAPTAAPANALPINHPAMFQGMRPQNGQVPQSLWFARQFPDYDPNKPIG